MNSMSKGLSSTSPAGRCVCFSKGPVGTPFLTPTVLQGGPPTSYNWVYNSYNLAYKNS